MPKTKPRSITSKVRNTCQRIVLSLKTRARQVMSIGRPRPLNKFHLFQQLPIELRLKIWRETFPAGQGIGTLSSLLNPTSPVTLQVNFESREETLRHYVVLPNSSNTRGTWLEKLDRAPCYFNPKIDQVVIAVNSFILDFHRDFRWHRQLSKRVQDANMRVLEAYISCNGDVWNSPYVLSKIIDIVLSLVQYPALENINIVDAPSVHDDNADATEQMLRGALEPFKDRFEFGRLPEIKWIGQSRWD